jgi:diacylglycerol kinase family enzyme
MEPKVPTSVLVIYNPFSGNGRAQASLDAIRAPLERANIRIEVAPTQFPRHAFEMARDRDFSAFDCLMICGGDGTFHEVLNGLMNRPQGLTNTPPVAIIPGGTGNSCAVSMGIDDPAVAVQAVIQARTQRTDSVAVLRMRIKFCI